MISENELTDIDKSIIKTMDESAKIQAYYNNFKNPMEFTAMLTYLYKIDKNIQAMLKKDFYSLTNEALKKKLKEDFGVDEEVIKELKNKKELVDKIIEVM